MFVDERDSLVTSCKFKSEITPNGNEDSTFEINANKASTGAATVILTGYATNSTIWLLATEPSVGAELSKTPAGRE
ncbi:TPA: hypothetical protein DHT69_01075 [Candidatus Collierbacteria bacterium]|nr:hypothetical protein [Candidatus Collierbacteria bacterium]